MKRIAIILAVAIAAWLSVVAAHAQQQFPPFVGALTPGHCIEAFNASQAQDAGAPCGGTFSAAFSGLTSGTNTSATMIVGSGATFGATGSGIINATTAPLGGVSGLGSGVGSALGNVLNSSTGVIGDLTPTNNNCVVGNGTTWASTTCPGGGSTAFSALTTGTNTSATMTVGAGGTITFSSTGIVNANEIAGTAISLGTLTTGDYCTVTTGSPNVLNCNSSGVGGTISITDTNSDSATGVSTISLGAGLATVTGSSGTSPINLTETLNTQSGTGAYAIASTDGAKIILRTNASGGADTIVAASTTGYTAGFGTSYVTGSFAGNTITPTTSTINGLSVLKLGSYQGIDLLSDSTNYHAILGLPQPATQSGTTFLRDDMTWDAIPTATSSTLGLVKPDNSTITISGGIITAIGGSATSIVPGTTTIGGATAPCLIENSTSTTMACPGVGSGVVTALGNALSSAGGVTSTIASGTAVLGTSAISSGTCATVVTVTATNVATTDTLLASFNGDPTAVTGYIPSTSGMLTIISYPTAGNANFKVCNNTSASVTPGAITLNWRVVR